MAQPSTASSVPTRKLPPPPPEYVRFGASSAAYNSIPGAGDLFYMYVCAPFVCGDQKRALDLRELELQVVVSCYLATRK